MKNIVFFFSTVLAAATLSAFCTIKWMTVHALEEPLAAHEWLHEELQASAVQRKALEPIEAQFSAEQQHLVDQLHVANQTLARIIGEDKAYTPRVRAAGEVVQQKMGDLQNASLRHVFTMRSVLSPEQGEKLLHLAQRSLEQTP